jgi:RNA polymerase sigma-70 factor (ECF subfamily)
LNQLPDEQLVAACRSGDTEAFATLVRRHTMKVYAVCLGATGDAAGSEDLTQESFIRSHARMPQLQEAENFAAWVVQIARNLCRDHHRTTARRRQLLAERPDREPAAETDDYSDLHEALAGLPEKHRTPLLMYYFDGQDASRLARKLGISEAGAYTRLSRARNALRQVLTEVAGGREESHG